MLRQNTLRWLYMRQNRRRSQYDPNSPGRRTPPGVCPQARNKVRQRYIMSEEQAEVASQPPGAAKVRPANNPWEEQREKMQHSRRSTPESDYFWQDVLPEWRKMVPECSWHRDQGERTRLWEEKEPGELPDSNVNKVWSTPRCYWCEDSKASQGRTN